MYFDCNIFSIQRYDIRGPTMHLHHFKTLYFLSIVNTGEGLHHLSFQDDGQATSTSWAMWGCPPQNSVFATNTNLEEKCLHNSINEENFTSFSVCYFFKMTNIKHSNVAFSFISSNLSIEIGK